MAESRPSASAGFSPASLTRRQVVAGMCAVATCAMLGGVQAAFAGECLVRPPGFQDERRLWAACIRCGRCVQVCPANCIAFGTIEQGLLNTRAPYMNFRHGGCDLCDGLLLCQEVCPVDAWQPFDCSADAMGVAVVVEDRCVAWMSPGSCQVCADICPRDAVVVDERGCVEVDAQACNGCGICEFHCPSSSLLGYAGSGLRGITVVQEGGAA